MSRTAIWKNFHLKNNKPKPSRILHNSAELDLMRTLRMEADAVKETFSKYSFQSWAFTIAFIAVLMRLQKDNPEIGAAGVFPLVLLLAVLRIGMSTYTSANRIYGFELYLNRRRRLRAAYEKELELGWEEANYVWRTVQSSLYTAVFRDDYEDASRTQAHSIDHQRQNRQLRSRSITQAFRMLTGSLSPLYVRKETELFGNRQNRQGRITIWPGTFMRTHFYIVALLCVICQVPIFYSCYRYIQQGELIKSGLFAFLIFTSVALTILRMKRLNSRRQIIEDGMYSINSCAFLWKIVAEVHFKTLDELKKQQLVEQRPPNPKELSEDILISYRNYSKEMRRLTEDLITSFEIGDEGIYDFLRSPQDSATNGEHQSTPSTPPTPASSGRSSLA